jgi:hypothetical protein
LVSNKWVLIFITGKSAWPENQIIFMLVFAFVLKIFNSNYMISYTDVFVQLIASQVSCHIGAIAFSPMYIRKGSDTWVKSITFCLIQMLLEVSPNCIMDYKILVYFSSKMDILHHI